MKNAPKPASILIVEDDAELRESMIDVLADEGHRVTAAGDGLQALAALAGGPLPELILLDLMMPKMNGAQFREEQLKNPLWASIPVVVLTAQIVGDHERERLRAHAFIAKPFEIAALLEEIDRILRRTRESR